MRNPTLKTRVAALFVAAALLLVSIPIMLSTVTGAAELGTVTKVVDPSTMDHWRMLFPADNTKMAGRIWTDKSVFADTTAFDGLVDVNGKDVNLSLLDRNNFLVVLSALASNKSIVGYSYTPTDTVLVLDVSKSMANSGYVDELVTATNSAIAKLLELNKHNRIGIVIYSSDATVVLPLDRYTQSYEGTDRVWQGSGWNGQWVDVPVSEKNLFLVNDGQSSISINRGVQNSSQVGTDRFVRQTEYEVEGGTYMQAGLYAAKKQFTAVSDTVIPDGQVQAGATRTPVLVVMSDGLPTFATSYINGRGTNTASIGDSNIGTGSTVNDRVLQNAIDFVNQLTAANAVYEIGAHYAADPLVYTLGLGANNQNLSSASLNPSGFTATDALWKEYVDAPNGSGLVFDIQNDRRPDQRSVTKLTGITSVDQKNYVTNYYPASNAAGLISAFDRIVKQIIIQSLYYPTLVDGNEGDVDHDGYIEFIDDIGHYMEIKDIKGIIFGEHLFTGERLAHAFTGDSDVFYDDNGNFTDFANHFVWSVMERLGIASIAEARDLINRAYETGQLSYTSPTEWSNYIGWYADDEGNFLGHWHEGHTEKDIPTVNGVKATYINKSYGMLGEITDDYTETDMMYISTQIHTRISDGNVSMIWRIPASLIPVVSYNIHLIGETIEDATSATISYAANTPIRLLFEVGLSEEIHAVNVSDKVADTAAHILDADGDGISDDGKYYFYTNWWDDDNLTHSNPSKTHDTVVFFEPSHKNESYFYAQDTPVLVSAGDGYVPYTGKMPTSNDGNTYYREYIVFEGNAAADENGRISADIVAYHEKMSKETIDAITEDSKTAAGVWYVPMGVVHRVFDEYNVEKTQNETGTIKYVSYPALGDYDPTDNIIYVGSILGNNGRLAMDIPEGIKITKEVDDTLYGTDDAFTFTVRSEGVTGEYRAYLEEANGALTAGSVTFRDGETTISLKAGQSLYILGLSAESTYTVTEAINGSYRVSKITVNGQTLNSTSGAELRFDRYTIAEAVFTNTLSINDGTIVVSKEVVTPNGIIADPTHAFRFAFYKEGDDASNDVVFTLTDGETKTFDGLAAGTYIIEEFDLPNGYASNASENMIRIVVEDHATEAYTAHFVNTYTPASVKPSHVIVDGTKALLGRDWMEGDSFSFALEMLEGTVWKTLDTQTVTYDANKAGNEPYGFTFDFGNNAKLVDLALTQVGTYHFRVIEIIPDEKLGGVTYDEIYRYFHIEVTDEDLDGALEIGAVTATNNTTTVTADITSGVPVWHVKAAFNNKYLATEGDELVINIHKTVKDDLNTGIGRDGFLFGLYAAGGTEPLLVSAPTDAQGNTSFRLMFPARFAGMDFTYEIREIVPEDAPASMTYDDTVIPVTIIVEDNNDGTVTAWINGDEELSTEMDLSFTNVYQPAAASLILGGKKIMAGRDFAAGEFTFELRDRANELIASAENVSKADGGYFTFASLTFDELGTTTYTVVEKKGSLGGVTYSETVYTIVVTVSDDADKDGSLDLTVTVDGEEVALDAVKEAVVFTNLYEVKEGAIRIRGVKTLQGKTLVGEDFEFILSDREGNPIETVRNQANGDIIFSDLPVNEEGVWEYRVSEVIGEEAGMTYDDTVYAVKVTAVDNGDGTFAITYEYRYSDGTTAEDGIVFENSYQEPQPENPDTADGMRIAAVALTAALLTMTTVTFSRKKKKHED